MKFVEQLEFEHVRGNVYLCKVDEEKLKTEFSRILRSFTITTADKYSVIADKGLTEQLLARIVSDGFIVKHEHVFDTDNSICVINVNVDATNYTITMGVNRETLGGIVYNLTY